MQLQVLPDNDTSVIRGSVIKKTGWPRGQWSGANPPPECFPFSGVPGANKRDHTKPFPNAIQGKPGRRFLYISEKEYANEPQKYQTGGRIHTDDPVCGLPGSLSERKKRSAPQGKPQTGTKTEMLRIDMALLVSLALNVLTGSRSE